MSNEPDTAPSAGPPPPVIPRQRGPNPCLRHHVWLVSCADCTAWHAGRLTAARTDDRG